MNRMNDLELTRLQETGSVPVSGLSVAAIIDGLTTLGISPLNAFITHDGRLVV